MADVLGARQSRVTAEIDTNEAAPQAPNDTPCESFEGNNCSKSAKTRQPAEETDCSLRSRTPPPSIPDLCESTASANLGPFPERVSITPSSASAALEAPLRFVESQLLYDLGYPFTVPQGHYPPENEQELLYPVVSKPFTTTFVDSSGNEKEDEEEEKLALLFALKDDEGRFVSCKALYKRECQFKMRPEPGNIPPTPPNSPASDPSLSRAPSRLPTPPPQLPSGAGSVAVLPNHGMTIEQALEQNRSPKTIESAVETESQVIGINQRSGLRNNSDPPEDDTKTAPEDGEGSSQRLDFKNDRSFVIPDGNTVHIANPQFGHKEEKSTNAEQPVEEEDVGPSQKRCILCG